MTWWDNVIKYGILRYIKGLNINIVDIDWAREVILVVTTQTVALIIDN